MNHGRMATSTASKGALSLGKAEDSAHATGDVGVMALAVRQDSQVDFGADGDYVPLSIDASGQLRVTGGGGGGSTQYEEDTAHASGDTGTMVLGVRQDAQVDFGADGDYVPLSIDGNGAVRVSTALAASAASIGSVKLNPGTNEIGKLAAGTAAIGSVTVSGTDAENAAAAAAPVLVGGRYDSSARTLGAGDAGALALTAAGHVIVNDGGTTLSIDDGGGAITVDGTVALGAGAAAIGSVTLGAGTAEIGKLAAGSAVIGTVTVQDGGGSVSVDDGGGTLTVDGTVTLGAGSAAVGKLSANSGVDIGDVDVTSVVPGTAATNLGKAEGGAHSASDVGAMALGVRYDTDVYTPLSVDELGALLTRAPARHPIAYSTEVTVSTFMVLVDLSDTASFPHDETGYVVLDRLAFDVQFSTGSAVANIKVGVITRIDGTDADVSWLYHAVPGAANVYDHRRTIEEFPGGLKFYVSGGGLQDAVTNIVDEGLASINTGLTLDSAVGSVTPAVGDVVMELGYDTDTFNIALTALYHTEAVPA